MKSEFEKNAAQEAVAAVERRYERNQKMARQARGRLQLGRVVVVVILIAGGILAWQMFSGYDLKTIPMVASMMSHPFFKTHFGPPDPLSGSRREYGNALQTLLTGELKLSSEMPDELNVKKAKPGVRYAVLTQPADGWFGLYELTRLSGDVAVSELSPVASPRQVKVSALQAACAGKPYLVAVSGRVYLFGSKDQKDAERLRRVVRELATPAK